ncbi:MAG: aminotransferase class V-fold PLP-dependent enzyme [Cyanobacterium sp. T60_A2020_053]|nr:aminotransferase class V-fold PLP-dependent enzyme [Cyanobacterium sp. T60_A2020_053]
MIDNIAKIRAPFTGLQDKYYFNYGGQGILPQPALTAIIDGYQYIDKIGPFGMAINSWINTEMEATREVLAHLTQCEKENITLTENVTGSCNIALWGIPWQSGDEILLTDAEHPGVIASCQEIAKRFGVILKTCAITNQTSNILEIISNNLSSRTRLLVISHVLWNTGEVLPLKEICDLCHNYRGAKPLQVLVDGAQSAGLLALDLPATGADFYGCTGHKWLCGPAGVGFLYVKPNLNPPLLPTFIGWRGLDFANPDLPFYDDGRIYEVATSAYPLYMGLRRALEFHQQWGDNQRRYERICQLSEYLWTELDKIDGIQCVTMKPPQSGLVSFYVEQPQHIVNNLEGGRFFLRTLAYPSCVRACVHYFTLESEIETLIKTLRGC